VHIVNLDTHLVVAGGGIANLQGQFVAGERSSSGFRLQDFHLLRFNFPVDSANLLMSLYLRSYNPTRRVAAGWDPSYPSHPFYEIVSMHRGGDYPPHICHRPQRPRINVTH
jgi:hypothetical protein